MFYKYFLRPLLFTLDPEDTHETVVRFLKIFQGVHPSKKILTIPFCFSDSPLQFELLGRKFGNPVGLAAGFDKNCEVSDVFSCFGFGFVEGGTVTAKAQVGNPKPRVFRLPKEEALINRLGFNNRGSERVGECLGRTPQPSVPFGINIGKSAATPLEDAIADYLFTFEKLYPFADYFAVNVSSPNTPRLRELQKDLAPLLSSLQKKNSELSQAALTQPKPILVKIAPDLSFSDLEQISECCINHKVAGVIATNTTVAREGIQLAEPIDGGLSGRPLEKKSTEVVRYLYKKVKGKMIIIGVGGIFNSEDAYRKIKAGASLVQLYTGWVYGGPSTVSCINRGLVSFLKRDGLKNIQDAVGVES